MMIVGGFLHVLAGRALQCRNYDAVNLSKVCAAASSTSVAAQADTHSHTIPTALHALSANDQSLQLVLFLNLMDVNDLLLRKTLRR